MCACHVQQVRGKESPGAAGAGLNVTAAFGATTFFFYTLCRTSAAKSAPLLTRLPPYLRTHAGHPPMSGPPPMGRGHYPPTAPNYYGGPPRPGYPPHAGGPPGQYAPPHGAHMGGGVAGGPPPQQQAYQGGGSGPPGAVNQQRLE